MKSKAFVALVIVLLLNCFSCKETPTADGNGNGGSRLIVAEDIGVTDVLLKIHMPGAFDQRTVTLKRDTVTILNKAIFSRDTLIIDEGLLPKHTYLYTISFDMPFGIPERGTIAVTTMDTTSHNFTWEIITLGDGFSHGFRDVAIINDTLAYAVGEIYKKDSTGQFETEPYNVAQWNGHNWLLLRVPTRMYGGYIGTFPLTTVLGFSQNDIWTFSTAGSYSHWNGQQWSTEYVAERSGGGTKLWGTSSSNLYLVGTDGSISHYDGSSWRKMESGTNLNIVDIYGSINPKTGEEEVLAVASNKYENRERIILKITGSTVTALPDSGVDNALTGVWFIPGKKYYLSGGSIYKKRNPVLNLRWSRDVGSMYPYFKNAIRGNGINDIVIACDRGNMLHFDGYSWEYYYQWTYLDYGNYYNVAIRNNLVVAVGDNYGYGVIAMGRR